MKKTILTVAILGSLLFSTSVSAHEDTDPDAVHNHGGFTLTPAYPNTINARKFIFEIAPGTSVTDYILVRNLSDVDEAYLLYGADPTLSNQGTPAYKTRQNGGDGEGSWIKFQEPEALVNAGGIKLFKFTLNVPENTPLGDYRAGITMERVQKDKNNAAITIATRVILHSDIKVTDDPQPVPHDQEPPQDTKLTAQTPYYWVFVGLFIISIGFLAWSSAEQKPTHKKKRKR